MGVRLAARPAAHHDGEQLAGQRDVVASRGTLASVDANRFAQVLVMALARNDAFSPDRLITRAKKIGRASWRERVCLAV